MPRRDRLPALLLVVRRYGRGDHATASLAHRQASDQADTLPERYQGC